MSDVPEAKPAILQDSKFVVREGLAYRACRTGAIWLNKMFFSSLILLGIWLVVGGLSNDLACATVPQVGNITDNGTTTSCNVFLTPTAGFLGAMAIASFLGSIALGMLGLVVGKQVLAAAKADEEVGAGRDSGSGAPKNP
ncbi:MAG: hypothetical protein AABX89_05145 [Candidatus Thermoplasmatota archaeon]